MARHDWIYDEIVFIIIIVIIIVVTVILWKWINKIWKQRRGRSNSVGERSSMQRSRSPLRRICGSALGIATGTDNTENFSSIPTRFLRRFAEMARQLGHETDRLSQPYPIFERYGVQSKRSKHSRRTRDSSSSSHSSSSSSECRKPRPPFLWTTAKDDSIIISWDHVHDADYYDIYLLDQNGDPVAMEIFFTGTTITFSNLPPGVYYVYAFSGSNDCGVRRRFSKAGPINIGSPPPQCAVDTDCPPSQHCVVGNCVPGCTTDINCPMGETCQNGTCQTPPPPQCTVDVDCPQGQHCVGANCIPGCTTNINCPAGETCQGGICQPCATPVITGVTLSGSWPGPIQFTFTGTGFSPSGATFTFSWQALGSTGQIPIAGFLTPLFLSNNQWPSAPVSNFPTSGSCLGTPCCAFFNFGCPAAGCGGSPAPTVIMEFQNVVVTNACGASSAPTCWRFTSLCPGGSTTGTQFTC